MIAIQLITPDFPFLDLNDSVAKARLVFSEQFVNHLAVVSNYQLQGILPLEAIADPDLNGNLADFKDDFIKSQIFTDQHGLDIFEMIAKLELSVIPVTDLENNYKGSITAQDLLYNLSSIYAFRHYGGIIVLSMGLRDYNLSEISRIVESNNGKIVFMCMDSDENTGTITLTLKLDTLDISRIIATFERFKYKVDFQQPPLNAHNDIQERYELLMKMLDL